MPAIVRSYLRLTDALSATVLPLCTLNQLLICCDRVQKKAGGFVRTGRGVVQKHLFDLDLTRVETLVGPLIKVPIGLRFRCVAAWINISGPRQFHNWHWHTGCDHSVIVYLDDIVGQPGRCGQTAFRRAPDSNLSFYLKPARGLMLDFDALLPHKTIPIMSGVRRTLAIDGDFVASS